MKMERSVVTFACATRACVTLLALATAALVTPYDTSSHLQAGGSPLAALSNWDGVYFSHIARSGYDFEHFHAFFPLYPLLARWAARLLPLDEASGVLAAGWLLSNVSFVLAALFLYRLGCVVLQDEVVARRAAYLFCVAPSSIFMSAVYSESLMCLLSFSGMYFLARHAHAPKPRRAFRDLVYCALLFGAASATRSNGILLSLFIAWHRVTVSPSPRELLRFLGFWIRTAGLGVLAVAPQVVYFVAAMVSYCPSIVERFGGEALSSGVEMEDRSWCAKAVPNFTAMYTFIQSEYWNVGLFRYYELKQVPNFLLAAPIVGLSLHALQGYFRGHVVPGRLQEQGRTWRGTALTPYYVHWLFLVVNALLVVHIQVTTRLLCACPPLFWHPAALVCCPAAKRKDASVLTRYGRLVVAYFLLFTVLGSVLFPSFYPWT
ncbi:glycosyltransferase family 76 protein [Phytophthora cinnamomi]|uniref:glycosyltransferase family 76 protein n=1 Tax=Phytophthora cinnamomi TaxID=4785 RepID=UPI00355A9C33|nr:glycosyltransferase family 76 protein [Phytophthora cinnamomi]